MNNRNISPNDIQGYVYLVKIGRCIAFSTWYSRMLFLPPHLMKDWRTEKDEPLIAVCDMPLEVGRQVGPWVNELLNCSAIEKYQRNVVNMLMTENNIMNSQKMCHIKTSVPGQSIYI